MGENSTSDSKIGDKLYGKTIKIGSNNLEGYIDKDSEKEMYIPKN